ncbi:MAG: type II secretion system protein GspG [Phycisphaerales bacterium]
MNTRTTRARRGFSLLELMVVILIMGILATIVGINVIGRAEDARIDSTELTMDTIEDALKMYHLKYSAYPTSIMPLVPNYLEEVPVDGWKNEFDFYSPVREGEYKIISYGKDGFQSEDDLVRVRPFTGGSVRP